MPGAFVWPPRSNPPRSSRLARSASDSIGAGWVNSVGGMPFMASAMKSCHMRAGHEPPVTVPTPWTPRIEMLPSLWPIQTAVERIGV